MIVLGYPGIGKTTFCKYNDKYIDLESSYFIKKKNWEEGYCKLAIDLDKKGFNVCISTHKKVSDYMAKNYRDKILFVFPMTTKTKYVDDLRHRYLESNLDKDYKAYKRAKRHYINDVIYLRNANKDCAKLIIPGILGEDATYNELWREIDNIANLTNKLEKETNIE